MNEYDTLKRLITIEKRLDDLIPKIEMPVVTAYTPTWTASVSNPAIVNGTITGRYVRTGKLCFVNVNITMGASTTYGSGAWRISLPFTVANQGVNYFGVATCYDNNAAARYDQNCVAIANGVDVRQFVPQTAGTTVNTLTSAIPFTWASGDIFAMTLWYEVA